MAADKIQLEKTDDDQLSSVVYIGRIPHGFYEVQMRKYFTQFGVVKKLRISRNKTSGKSKHYGFVEFETPEIAGIVADAMHNYMMFNAVLKCEHLKVKDVHPGIWKGANKKYISGLTRKDAVLKHLKVRNADEIEKRVHNYTLRARKSKNKLAALGIDYEPPQPVDGKLSTVKRVKQTNDEKKKAEEKKAKDKPLKSKSPLTKQATIKKKTTTKSPAKKIKKAS